MVAPLDQQAFHHGEAEEPPDQFRRQMFEATFGQVAADENLRQADVRIVQALALAELQGGEGDIMQLVIDRCAVPVDDLHDSAVTDQEIVRAEIMVGYPGQILAT